jgi:hypothetical protein
VRGTAAQFAWLLPVRAGAFVDTASDAWLEALAAATTPRVVPPDPTPPCGIPGGAEVEGSFTHALTTPPESMAVAADMVSLQAALASWGLVMTTDVAQGMAAAFAAGDSVVALQFAAATGDVVTRTVRVVDDSPESFSLSLLGGGAQPVDVTAYAFTTGASALGSGPPVAMDPMAILWTSAGTSTYATASAEALAASPGAWLFESMGPAPLFDSIPVANSDPIPSATTTYFYRASAYDDASESPATCADTASAWATSDATVATACPAGSLARVGDPTCQELVGAGQLDPSALRCGGIADDLAIALSGLAPASTWITRARSAIAAEAPGEDSTVVASPGPSAFGPVVTASGYAETCEDAGTAAAPSAPPDPGFSGSGSGGSAGPGSDPGPTAGAAAAVQATGAAANVAVAASDGCGGDSSDSSDDDSCSGDSSEPTDDSGSGCSGGGGGDSSDDCTMSRHRKSRTSRVALVLVALAAMARRRRRAQRERMCA